ncbi:hypothetical protein [uncultured Methanolobus sp.]|uniref:hypothetical protein n=1 Tax=uncultured Methanolobus sp. TaxID=218300 RepID=UPI0029C7704C|nr:hypothetical protein [uncultured Methanolobus sp.]
MRVLKILFIALLLLVLPAAAETYTFEDTSGHDYYAICANVSDYRPIGIPYGFSPTDTQDENYISNSEYDTFIVSTDDVFSYLDFQFKPEESFQLPVTLWYEDGQRDLFINVQFETESSWIFWFTDSLNVTVTDLNSNILVSKTYTNVFDELVRVRIESDSISISQNDWKENFWTSYLDDSSINISLYPLTALTFDLTALNNTSSYTVVKVIDDQYTVEEQVLPGWMQWLYNRISFMDPDMVLYNALTYVDFMWGILMFLLKFMLFSTWSYFILANVVGLFYGILQANRGTFAMIQGYFTGLYYSFLLPIHIFKFVINLFLSLIQAILPI